MRIALIGFMGCGKSSVGKKLSALLSVPFIDLDGEIERRCGASIARLFSTIGEDGFRNAELSALRESLSRQRDFILATGGGTVVSAEAVSLLKKNTFCIYLEASAEHLEKILSTLDNSSRPLLRSHAVEELLAARKTLYRETADVTLALSSYTDGVPDDTVFESIAMDAAAVVRRHFPDEG